MAMIVSGAFAVAGMIHLLPLRGLAGDDALAALYGVEVRDATTRVLLRHRALQLGAGPPGSRPTRSRPRSACA